MGASSLGQVPELLRAWSDGGHARAHGYRKHGGGAQKVTLYEARLAKPCLLRELEGGAH